MTEIRPNSGTIGKLAMRGSTHKWGAGGVCILRPGAAGDNYLSSSTCAGRPPDRWRGCTQMIAETACRTINRDPGLR